MDLEYAQAFAPEEAFPNEEKIAWAVALAGRKDAAVIVCGLRTPMNLRGLTGNICGFPRAIWS